MRLGQIRLTFKLSLVVVALTVCVVLAIKYRFFVFQKKFQVVEEGAIYRGAEQTDGVFRELVTDLHCKSVISLMGSVDNEAKWSNQNHIKYYTFTWNGSGWGAFDQYYEVGKLLHSQAERPIFFHCAAGDHRANAATFAYLLESGHNAEDALDILVNKFGMSEEEEEKSELAAHLRDYAVWREKKVKAQVSEPKIDAPPAIK